jgi:hypothetical protein
MRSIALLFLLMPVLGWSQNLVLNPSFEDTLVIENTSHLYLCSNWILPTAVSSDWFSTNPDALCSFCCCGTQSITENFGYQTPLQGEAIAGIILYTHNSQPGEYAQYKEYIEGTLSEQLIAGSRYIIKLNLSLSDSSAFAVNKLGVYFSHDPVDLWSDGDFSISELNLNPQVIFTDPNYFLDSDNWIQVSATYEASGSEQYFIIGSFDANDSMIALPVNESALALQHYSHYFFDEICVSPDTTDNVESIQNKPPYKFSNNCLLFENNTNATVEIFDLMGRLLMNQSSLDSPICIDNFEAGQYLIVVRNEKIFSVAKKMIHD